MSEIFLGTASWSAPSWSGPFYPAEMPPADYLSHYAQRFRTVEVDSTWYRAPSARMVDGWNAKTPADFVFSVKVPQTITHEKTLVDCDAELEGFLSVMKRLGPKLGPLLFQFPYFKKAQFETATPFLERLAAFLPRLPRDERFVVEIRNKSWLGPELFRLLNAHRVTLALIDHPWMPTAPGYARVPGILTSDSLYIRWLGDRYAIEEITTEWDELVVDRSRETANWVRILRELTPKVARTYAYYNNHYAGCAFRSAELFQRFWETLDPDEPATRPGA